MMAERGVSVDHSTVHRRDIKLLPVLEKAFRRHKRSMGKSWRVDETDIKVGGQWKGSGANRLGESVEVFSPTIWWSVMSKRNGLEALFDGRHFYREIIILCVRWYFRYELILRDLVEMMAERGLSLVHTTIMHWVKRFTPDFVKRWNCFGIPTGRSWRVDEPTLRFVESGLICTVR
ncbi:hypothetical protein B0G75_13622 [Paraburkholderia sp. BL18I3N2]|nr:hypothetical protein B0G75_13622 [Paraburkholderia sp. BL18I3N2]